MRSLEDVTTGLAASIADESAPFDREALVVLGHSAGGHLALLATQPELDSGVTGVIGLAAITDIEAYEVRSIMETKPVGKDGKEL